MERVKAFFGRMFSGNDEDNRHEFIFLTKEEQEIPSKIKLPEPEKPPGLILEDGSINWNCPCLGGMVAGPCGVQFRTAFSCFHYSEAEPKGSDCMEAFNKMHECMQKYPALYGPDEKDDDEDIFGLEQAENDAEMSKGDRDPKPVVNRSDRSSKSVVDGGELDPKSVVDKGNRDPQSVAQINNEDPPTNESQDQEVEIKNSST